MAQRAEFVFSNAASVLEPTQSFDRLERIVGLERMVARVFQ